MKENEGKKKRKGETINDGVSGMRETQGLKVGMSVSQASCLRDLAFLTLSEVSVPAFGKSQYQSTVVSAFLQQAG